MKRKQHEFDVENNNKMCFVGFVYLLSFGRISSTKKNEGFLCDPESSLLCL